MTADRIEKLLDRYKSLDGGARWGILSELESVADLQPEELVPHTDRLVELFLQSGGGMRQRFAGILQALVEQEDRAARTILETLGGRPDPDGMTRRTVLQAAIALGDSRAEVVASELTVADVEPALSSGDDADQIDREQIYRLLGLIGGPESVELVLRHAPLQHGETAPAVQKALKSITEEALQSLQERNDTGRAVETIATVAEHQPAAVAPHVRELYGCLREGADDSTDRLADALVTVIENSSAGESLEPWQLVDQIDELESSPRMAGRVVGSATSSHSGSEEVSVADIADQLIDGLASAATPAERRARAVALTEIVRKCDDDQLPDLDRVLEVTEDPDPELTADYATLLRWLASVVPDAGLLGPRLVSYLDSESAQARTQAARALVGIGLYPVPDAVQASREDPESDVRSAIQNIDSTSPPGDAVPDTFDSASSSRLLGMDSALMYHSEPGRWDPVSFDPYHRRLLENLSEKYQNGGSGHIRLPYYEPEATLLTPIELAIHGISRGRHSGTHTVVMYSPRGSSFWGNWSEFEAALHRHGISSEQTSMGAALPLDEWFHTGHVYHGDLVERPSKLDSGLGRLILVQSSEDIEQLDQIDAVVCHLQSRCPRRVEETIEQIREHEPEVPLYVQYSLYTEHTHDEGWSRFGFSRAVSEELSPVLSQVPQTALGGGLANAHRSSAEPAPVTRACRQIDALGAPGEIEIHSYPDPSILSPLNSLYGQIQDLDASEIGKLVREARSVYYFFMRMPVPVDLYDDWVRQEALYQGRYTPETTADLRRSIDSVTQEYDLPYASGAVQNVLDPFDELTDALEGSSPKFEHLIDAIREAADSDRRLAILFLSRQSLRAFRFAVRQRLGLDLEDPDKNDIHLCVPREVRTLQEVDRLIFTGDPPKEHANLYVLPSTDRIEILTYGGDLEERLREWIGDQTDQLREDLGVGTDDWPGLPTVRTVLHEFEDPSDEGGMEEVASDIADLGTVSSPGSGTGTGRSPPRVSDTNDSAGGGGRQPREIWTVTIRTESGNRHRLDSNRSVLIRGQGSGPDRPSYVWIRARDLQEGDDFVIIPRRVRQRMFEEMLERLHEGESDNSATGLLRRWWTALREIESKYEKIEVIYSLLDREGITKSETAVRDWFRSVAAADEPIDLVMYQDLTIGPDSADDIHLIGRVFDRPELVQQADQVQQVMKEFRQQNRELGRQLNEEILERLREGSLQQKILTGTIEAVSHDR